MSAPTVGVFPTAPQLLCAFQGRRFDDREMLRSAHALAELHHHRVRVRDMLLAAELDCRRIELIDEIDEWTSQVLPLDGVGLVVSQESLGAVIDRMARSWVAANAAIDEAGAGSESTHKHWYHLAELVDGYTDLIAGVNSGRAR